MDLQLKDKVVIVTGGTSGIGEAIVYTFAAEKAITIIVGRNTEKGLEIEKEIKATGVEAMFVKADLTDMAQCKSIVDQTLAKYGKIDCLVNNAGINDGVTLEAGPEAFVQSLQKNLIHYYAMAHYCIDSLIKTKGNIINIGSIVANTGQGGTSGYAASKGGVQALTREWAAAMINKGVRVNEVIPAETWTPLYESWVNSIENPDEKINDITKHIPFGKRFTTSEEIANMVISLIFSSGLANVLTQDS